MTLLLLRTLSSHDLVVCWATPWDRLISHLRAHALDRQIAEGASPEASRALALRARILVRPTTRRRLARRISSILSEATATPTTFPLARSFLARRNVLESADALRRLVVALLRPAPLPAQGVATVQLMLTDGTGPLYNPHGPQPLCALVDDALRALDPLPRP